MKWICLIIFLLPVDSIGQVQPAAEAITYKNFTSLPVFPLLDTDSNKIYTNKVVQKNKPTVIIYFSPTCNHCQHQAEEITSHYNQLRDINFLFVSAYDLMDIRQFSQAYALARFNNILVAHDPYGNLRKFMELQTLPGILLYSAKGKLSAARFTNLTTDTLLALIRK